MSIGSEVIKYLESKSAVTDLVSSRIYFLRMPEKQQTYPAIVVNLPNTTYGHYISLSDGIAIARVQFDCLATSSTEADSVAEAIRSILDGYRGTLDTAETISSTLQYEQDMTQPPVDGSAVRVYRKMAEYHLQIRVSIPTP